jgi:hypothetical protein
MKSATIAPTWKAIMKEVVSQLTLVSLTLG